MRTVILDLPDTVASAFEALPAARKANMTMLAVALAQAKPTAVDQLFAAVDERVAASDITQEEINRLLDELS